MPWDPASLFNFASPSYFQRPDKRYTLGAFAHYDISDQVTAYTQLMFMNDQTVAQFAPAGLFYDFAVDIRCDNPLLTPQEVGAMGCTAPTDVFSPYIGRRNVEGGPRRGDIKHDNYRGVFGFKGDIDPVWRYDVSYQYAEVDNNIRNSNYTNTANIANALDVVNDPTLGIVCQSVVDGSDPTCVPWNIFQTGGVTQAATDYIAASYYETSSTDQTVLTGYVQGDLGQYGVKSPWAESGIDIVIGAERRQENLDYNPDDAAQRGDIGGLAAPLVPVKRRIHGEGRLRRSEHSGRSRHAFRSGPDVGSGLSLFRLHDGHRYRHLQVRRNLDHRQPTETTRQLPARGTRSQHRRAVRSGHRQPVRDGERSVPQERCRATRSASTATRSTSARAPA